MPAEAGAGAINSVPMPDAKAPAVLQVLPSLVTGGVERGTADVAAALTSAGWRAIVASAGGPMVREIERAGAEHVTLPLDRKNPLTIKRNASALADIIRSRNISIVHARSRAPALSASSAAKQCRVPFVTTFHGTYNFANPLKKAYNATMSSGDRVIAISEFIAEHIRHNYATPSDRIRTIPRGIDVGFFNPDAVSEERMTQLARAWRLPDASPVIMLPGRLTRWKGQSVLIEAARRLGRQDVRVLLVGDDQGRTGYRKELEKQIARIGAESIIHLTGPCRDMPAAYMLADVVVSASTDPEAFGRVAAEAQAMGRPVIATNHGGSRETVVAGETGWLVPPGDADELARALCAALSMSSEERSKLARRAVAHIHDKYTKTRMCERTLEVYAELTTSP